MIKLFSAFVYAYYWSGCLKAYDSCDYEKALERLSKADFVAKYKKAQFHIMKAQLQYILGNEEKSCAEIKTSVDLLDQNTNMSPHDKQYLNEYCGFLIAKMGIDCSTILLHSNFDLGHVKTENVSKRFVDVFPIKADR